MSLDGNNNNIKPDDSNSNRNNITIKRSTFTKILVIGVAALMFASFFGGYTFRASFYPNNVGPTLVAANGNGVVGGLAPQQQPVVQAPGAAIGQPPPQITKVASVNTDGAPMKGKADAPITLVEFGDFQCPFCSRFASDTLQQLEKSYVDTGKLKFVYKEYPLPFHPNAQPSALAAECANEQGKFWPMHDKLYATQTTWENQDAATVKKTFKEYGVSLGLNAASFNSCIDSSKYSDKIQKESGEGSQYGVSGTPTFYVGNQKAGFTQIVGAQPVSAFEQLIKQVQSGSA